MNDTAHRSPDGENRVLLEFLQFLVRDVQSHPERLQALDHAYTKRLLTSTRGISVDLEKPLVPEDE